jgi:hypothetical protein
MATANKIAIHAPITQAGAYGYLLWLRQNAPAAYLSALKRVPTLRTFETTLRAESPSQLGDDFDVSDVLDTSDVSDLADSIDASPITVDLTDSLSTIDSDASILTPDNPALEAPPDVSVVAPSVPTLPPITPPPADSATAAVAASPSMSSSLGTIAAIAIAAAPVVAAVINHSTATINASTLAKTQGAIAAQYQVALVGQQPLTTGTVQGPAGNYIAAVQPAASVGQSSLLTATIGGIPLWIVALGGLGAALLLTGD